jgi:AraC-like DNA-binding protein
MQVQLRDGAIVFSIPHVHGWVSHASDAVGLGAITQFIRIMTDERVTASWVQFVATTPGDAETYQAFFGAPVRFGSQMAEIAFPLSSLDLPVLHANEDLYALLDDQARSRLHEIAPLNAALQSYRSQLLPLIRAGRIHIEDLAQRNGISVRTLQRRLSRAGTSFQALLDASRHQMAVVLLMDPTLQLVDVAQLVGYTEQSSFTRAFKLWSGLTPGEWRRRNVQAPMPEEESAGSARQADKRTLGGKQ